MTSQISRVREKAPASEFLEERNLVVFIWLCVVPVASMVAYYAFDAKTKYYYDYICLGLALTALVTIIARRKVHHSEFVVPMFWMLVLFAVIGLVKQASVADVLAWTEPQYFWTLVREAKPVAFLTCAMLVIGAFRPPTVTAVVKAGVFFASLVIVSVIVAAAVTGELQRPHVIDESNYDNFIVLMAMVGLFYIKPARFWVYYAVFLLATLLSQSKTGIIVFFILSAVYFIFDCKSRRVRLVFALLIVVSAPVIYLVFRHRLANVADIMRLDRIRMYEVFTRYMGEAGVWQYLFGLPVGVGLGFADPRLTWFVINQSEAINATGLHPFNLHGYHMRFITSWGILLYLVYWVVTWRLVRRFSLWKYLALLIFLEGVSMGVGYLSTISVMLWLFLASAGVYGREKSPDSVGRSGEWVDWAPIYPWSQGVNP